LLRLETSEDEASHRLLAYLKIDDDASIASGRAAFPERIIAEYVFPKAEPSIEVNVYWAAKAPTRLPEAIWMTFNPIAPDPMGWTMQKTGQRFRHTTWWIPAIATRTPSRTGSSMRTTTEACLSTPSMRRLSP